MSDRARITTPAIASAPSCCAGRRATRCGWLASASRPTSAGRSRTISSTASHKRSPSPKPAHRRPPTSCSETSMPADPHANGSGRNLRYVDAINEALAQALEADPRVFVFGLDVDDHKGIQGSTKGLPQRFGAERVFGTPLSEEAMTGVAIGAAMAGLRPVHVHIRMDFLMLCMNQLVNMAAKSRYMYGGQVRVPMVVRSMIGKSWGQG